MIVLNDQSLIIDLPNQFESLERMPLSLLLP
ncbi:Uncharacterised protein [Yersinia frederiksenii]|nr:Uncharacterised protein [Yersinia frederiksenii]